MDELIALSQENLSRLPEGVRTPRYDRTGLTPGIVHIGLGNFHRAHQAWYLHRLMDEGLARDWAILGAGVRGADTAQRDRLRAQDCLTTLIELAPTSTSAEVTGSMIDFLPVEEGNGALISALAEPEIRIVSLTVTESAYFVVSDGDIDPDHPDVRHDSSHPDAPRTAFGAMIAALRRRRDAGHGPFTVLSCDNLQGNGKITRRCLVGLAKLIDRDLAEWIGANCSFPNSMVDCIVPATGPKEMALAREFGIDDKAPVTHEPYRQWVIEDDFCAGRPEWEKVGATFSDKVHAFESMKLRILNAGHQLLANAGQLLSVDTISGCMEHPLISAFFHKVQTEEILPQVDPVPGTTPEAYLALIEERFSNPAIVDTTRRVSFDAASRHAAQVHPIIQERLKEGRDITGLALAEALWARMCAGVREDGSVIEPNDPKWEALNAAATAARSDPKAWLRKEFYGDLATSETFARAFSAWMAKLNGDGAEKVLRNFAG